MHVCVHNMFAQGSRGWRHRRGGKSGGAHVVPLLVPRPLLLNTVPATPRPHSRSALMRLASVGWLVCGRDWPDTKAPSATRARMSAADRMGAPLRARCLRNACRTGRGRQRGQRIGGVGSLGALGAWGHWERWERGMRSGGGSVWHRRRGAWRE